MAWFTTDEGKHVNTDWFEEDEKRKYKQLEQNQQEADRLNGKEKNKPALEPAKPTKNAEDAFNYIYRNARKLAAQEDADKIDMIAGGFNYKGDETPVLSEQALRGIQSKINSERKDLELDLELGVLSREDVQVRSKALDIVQRTLNSKANDSGSRTHTASNIERNEDGEILFKAMVTDRETGKRHSMEFSARTVEQARTDLSKNGYRVTPSTMLPKKLFDRVMNETNGYEWDWEDARKEFKEEMAKIQRRERRERRKNSQSGIDSYVQKAFDKANLIGESVDLDKVINSYKVLRDLPEAQKEEIYKDLAFRLFGARY